MSEWLELTNGSYIAIREITTISRKDQGQQVVIEVEDTKSTKHEAWNGPAIIADTAYARLVTLLGGHTGVGNR